MNFIWTFFEGLASFVSPCVLPMLPAYVAYFSADGEKKGRPFVRAFAFVFGFTLSFVLLGACAGSLGRLFAAYRTALNVVCGIGIALFGLSFLGVIRLPLKGVASGRRATGVIGAFVFGLVYSVSLTPCVGAFLGAALMQAAADGTAFRGALLLLVYALGLGVPFVLSAVFLSRLGGVFAFVKRYYAVVNPVCGGLLVLFGVVVACGGLHIVSESSETVSKEVKAMEVTLTAENFEAEVLNSNIPVIVDFWATWCGPCQMLGPVLAEIAEERAGAVKVGKVNVDEQGALAQKFGVMSIPALFVFKNGQVTAQAVGYMPKADVEALLAK